MLKQIFSLPLMAALLALTGCTTVCHNCDRTTDTYERTETVGQKIDDAAITSKVKAKFLAEKNFPSLDVHVSSTNQVVHLSGTVPSVRVAARAKDLALSVQGVREVINHLQVK